MRGFRGVFVAAMMALLAAPAFADLAAFNDKVKARDFKAATAEAAATWPGLDKTRPDIVGIAREFSFVAYLAGEYEQAKTWAVAAAGSLPEGTERTTMLLLLRLAEFRVTSVRSTRDTLVEALSARASAPGIDNITYIAADALVGFDFAAGSWDEAEASALLAAKLAEAGGAPYLDRRRRFQLFAQAAKYMRTKDQFAYFGTVDLVNAMAADMDAAPTEDEAMRLAPTYWEARAWAQSMDTHLRERKAPLDRVAALAYPRRYQKIYQDRPDRATCPTRIEFTRTPQYPSGSKYKGFVGAVIVKVDIDEKGLASNPLVLAAIPEQQFGRTVSDSVGAIRVKPGTAFAAGCSLAQPGRVIEYLFNFR